MKKYKILSGGISDKNHSKTKKAQANKQLPSSQTEEKGQVLEMQSRINELLKKDPGTVQKAVQIIENMLASGGSKK